MEPCNSIHRTYLERLLVNNGTINANVNGPNVATSTLTIAPTYITGNGTFEATNNGILSIGGYLNGTNITVHADTGTVQINGGTLGGSVGSTTGTGISFSTSYNSAIYNTVINGNVTFTGGAAYVEGGGSTVNGALTVTGTDMRMYDQNAVFTIGSGGSMAGYGTVDQYTYYSTGGTLVNNGTINANVSGKTLNLAPTNITGSGTFEATNNGTLSIGGYLNGSNIVVNATNGVVQVNGGGLGGSVNSTTGTGISFTNSGGNYIYNATVGSAANLTFGNGGFAYAEGNSSVLNGTATFSGGILRMYDQNAVFTVGNSGSMAGYGTIDQYTYYSTGGTLVNNGTINANVSGPNLITSTLNIAPTYFTNAKTGTVEATNGGNLAVTPTVKDSGNILVDSNSTATFSNGVTQTAGLTTIDGNASAGGLGFNLKGGTFVGDGALYGSLNNTNAGSTSSTVSPGSLTMAGNLTINGNYTQGASSNTQGATTSLLIKLGGTIQGTNFDLLSVSNAVSLHGNLEVQLIGGFTPYATETFDFLNYKSRTGNFDNILPLNSGYTYTVTYNDTSGVGTIHVLAVPEAGTVVSLGILLCGGGWALRRMRRQSEKEQRAESPLTPA